VNLDNRLYVRIDSGLYAQLIAFCKKHGYKVSTVLRMALILFLTADEFTADE